MYRSLRIAILSLGGALLVSGTGCEQRDMSTAPGALPRYVDEQDAPRITATTLFAHANLLERRGDFERAVVQYEKALAQQPNFLTARNRLGITLNKLGQHALASEQFRKCIEQKSTLAYLHNNLGFSLYLEGKYSEAEQETARAIELAPEFGRAHMNHAVVLSKLGRYADAFDELKAIGSQADACFNMGILLTEAGEYAKAAQYLEGALEADPKFEGARTQLREVSRLAAEAQARNISLASEQTDQPQRPAQPLATIGGIEDVQQNSPATIASPAAQVQASPTPTTTEQPLTVEQVWGVPAAKANTSETPAASTPPANPHAARTPAHTDASPAPTAVIEDVPINEIEPVQPKNAAQVPVQRDANINNATETTQTTAIAEPVATDATARSIEPETAPIKPTVVEPDAPAIAQQTEPVEIAPTTGNQPAEVAADTHTAGGSVVVETIDLDAQIQHDAQATPAPIAPHSTKANIDAPASTAVIDTPVTTAADTTEVSSTPTPVTPASKNTPATTSNLIVVETIQDVAVDPAPSPAPAARAAVQHKANAPVATPARQTPRRSTSNVVIEDVAIDSISDSQRIINLIVQRTQLNTHETTLIGELRCRIEELLDPENNGETAGRIQTDLASNEIDTVLADVRVAEILGAAGSHSR